MMLPLILFAARHGGGEGEAFATVVVVVLIVVGGLAGALRQASARVNVVYRTGVPYCPGCNRQVSFRRDECRACGYVFRTYGASGEEKHYEAVGRQIRRQEERKAWEAKALEHDLRRGERDRQRAAEKSARAAARRGFYKSRGIEPGPFAWFQALPDWLQPIVIGLCLPIPFVAILLYTFRSRV